MVDILAHRNKLNGRLVAHAGGDFGRPLGRHSHFFVLPMLFPFLKHWRRLYRARLCADRFRRGLRPDAGADRVSRRPYRRAEILLIGLTVGGLALIMLGLHLSYASLIVCAALLGLANSVYHPCDYAILSTHMDEARMGRHFSPDLRRFPCWCGGRPRSWPRWW